MNKKQIYHMGDIDSNGNYRGISRKEEGYLRESVINSDLPFAALVTAWYPKTQTIDVARPIRYGTVLEYRDVDVYGEFFDMTGTVRGPKIATSKIDNAFTAYRDKYQSDKTSSQYVLDNHIQALVTKTDTGYVATSFRVLNIDSPMIANCKTGRIITRHDDGSYYIHDEDGNFQFRHPSGLNIRFGSSVVDMDLEVSFPPHEKNVDAYSGGIQGKIEIPNGSGNHVVTIGSDLSVTHQNGNSVAIGSDISLSHNGGTSLSVSAPKVSIS